MDAGEREGQNVFVTRDPFLPYSDKLTNLTSVTCNHGCTTNISYIKVSKMNKRKSWPNWVKIMTKYREPLFDTICFLGIQCNAKRTFRATRQIWLILHIGFPDSVQVSFNMIQAEAEGAPLSSERAEPAMRLDALPLDFVLFVPLWWCAVTRVILPYLRGEFSQSVCSTCTFPLNFSIRTSGSLRPLKRVTDFGFQKITAIIASPQKDVDMRYVSYFWLWGILFWKNQCEECVWLTQNASPSPPHHGPLLP